MPLLDRAPLARRLFVLRHEAAQPLLEAREEGLVGGVEHGGGAVPGAAAANERGQEQRRR